MGIDILGEDILGVDILGIDILALPPLNGSQCADAALIQKPRLWRFET